MEQHRPYSEHLPDFLKQKPLQFIKYCLDRMPPKAEQIEKRQITMSQEREFVELSVRSLSWNTYNIVYDDNIPQCSCADFKKHHWVCKHILSVFEHFSDHGWDSLNPVYTRQPCFNVDTDIEEVVKGKLLLTPQTTTPAALMKDVPETVIECTDNPAALRKKCIEMLKNVQNNIYGTDNGDVLKYVQNQLTEIDTFLDKSASKVCNIPTRRHVKKKMTR